MIRFPEHSGAELLALVLFLTVAALGACATSVNQGAPTPGWPALKVTSHYVPHKQMIERCAPYVGYGSLPDACAEINLKAKTCDKWFSADFPPSVAIERHEQEHCEGYDHIGESALADMLRNRRAAP